MPTRNFVPNNDGEGNLGTSLKNWLKGWFKNISVSENITNGTKTVTVEQINQAILDDHVHANKDTLDKVTETIYRRIINSLSTGIVCGGILSINLEDNTKFDISEGCGIVVDNYTDSTNPVITIVTWNNLVGISCDFIGSTDEEYVAIDIHGEVVKQIDWFTPNQLRDYIILGTVGHTIDGFIDYVIPEVVFMPDISTQLQSFFDSFGAFNIEGNDFIYNGANLKINKTAGRTFDSGTNYVNSKKEVNIYSNNLENEIDIQYNYTLGSGEVWEIAEPTKFIDPTKYDTLTGLVSVPSGKWTIQTFMYYAPLNMVDVQYGQVYYESQLQALSEIDTQFVMNPLSQYSTLRGWLVVRQDATDLSDSSKAKFIQANKMGLISMLSSPTSGETNTSSNIGLSGIGLYLQKIGVDLQFKNILNASNKVSVVNNPTNKTVDIDIVESNIIHNNLGSLNNGDYKHLTALEKTNTDDAVTKKHSHDNKAQLDLVTDGDHDVRVDNPHGVTKTQVNLGNVQNLDQTNPANITQDTTHRFVTDTEKGTWNGKQDAIGFTPENVANKDTDGTLAANSDTKYASQKATKTCIDTGLGTKQASLGFTPENVANKDTDGTLAANSNTKYASQKATKTYADTKVDKSGSITQITTRNHSDLQNKNLETDIKHVTDNEKNGLDNANSPSTTNPVATQNDIKNYYAESDAPSTTGLGAFQTKLTLNVTPTITGNYKLDFYCEVSNTNNGQLVVVGVFQDATKIAGDLTWRNNADLYDCISGIKQVSLVASTAYAFTIKYYAGANTAQIRNARLNLRRVL